jgi:hypothetical protein
MTSSLVTVHVSLFFFIPWIGTLGIPSSHVLLDQEDFCSESHDQQYITNDDFLNDGGVMGVNRKKCLHDVGIWMMIGSGRRSSVIELRNPLHAITENKGVSRRDREGSTRREAWIITETHHLYLKHITR